MVAIARFINTDYIDRLSALSRGDTRSGSAVINATKGQSSSAPDQAIRAGVRLYTNAYSGMNFVGSMVNLARNDLEALQTLNSEMIDLAKEATGSEISKNQRRNLNSEFAKKAEMAKEVLDQSTIEGQNYLQLQGLKDSFRSMGLDSRSVESIKQVFNQFETLDVQGKLIDPSIKAEHRPLPKGMGLANPEQYSEDLYSYKRDLLTKGNAYINLKDLEALGKQIDTNLNAIEGLTGLLSENLELVRSTAVIFSEIGSAITNVEDAQQLADIVSQQIIQNAGQSMKHVENLEPIAVAALTLENSGLLEQ